MKKDWTGKKKVHEWGVVYQIKEPRYREFWHCTHCKRYKEVYKDKLFGIREMKKIARTNKVYHVDSNIRYK